MKKTVIIAAGGTGGHIYPALAIAEALRIRDPEIEVFFVGTKRGLENKIIPKSGYPLLHLPIGRLNHNVSLSERLMTVLQIPIAIFKAFWICLKLRPQFLLGVGGHASGPMLLAGSLLLFKTAIWEPNAMPGLANRILSRFVSLSLVTFDQTLKHLKTKNFRKVGVPIRKSIESISNVKKEHPGFHLLVYGGSQGAKSLNTAFLKFFAEYNKQLPQLHLFLQTGSRHFESVKKEAQELELDSQPQLTIAEYIHDMDQKYIWADLVACRSGMGTLSELAATGKPSLLIPLPTASNNHQQKNAEAFAEKGAAVMILNKDLTSNVIFQNLDRMIKKTDKLLSMSQNVRKFHRSDAADQVALFLLGQGEQKRVF